MDSNNRLVFRAFDGISVRYDVTGFEHGKENEMAGVFLGGDYYRIVKSIVNDDQQLHPCAIVDQFTGLLDKNGAKIFEGDILIDPLIKIDHYQSGNYSYGVVDFFNGTFRIGYGHVDKTLYDEIGVAYKQIVIGNIHQNHELLEKK